MRDTWSELHKNGPGSVYLKFTSVDDEPVTAKVAGAYQANLQRLQEIKAKYDPDNFFRRNNNIQPVS